MNHQIQTRDNCGPTSTAILLGFFDYWRTQAEVNEFVAPRPSPCTIANYITGEYGMRPELRRGYGVTRAALMARVYRLPRNSPEDRLAALRVLLANDIPVIVLQRLEPDSSISHYRVIQGYEEGPSTGDQAATSSLDGHFIVDDPYLGAGLLIAYDEFEDYLFRASYGAAMIPVYPIEQDSVVKSLMAELGVRSDARCGWTPTRLTR